MGDPGSDMAADDTVDAVVIGAGHNGLVAANLLADAGWDVLVLEATPYVGGAVRTAELTEPGFRHDVFSAFYPLSAVSPVIRGLTLERYGLRWRHAPAVLAHVLPDDRSIGPPCSTGTWRPPSPRCRRSTRVTVRCGAASSTSGNG